MLHHTPTIAGPMLAAALLATASANQPTFLGPLPYTSISDSPLFNQGQVCFEVEQFTGGTISVPGFSFQDNGSAIIEGIGVPPGGHVLRSNLLGTIILNFDPLGGGYPTRVGFVWTGGDSGTLQIEVIAAGTTLPIAQNFPGLATNPPDDPGANRFFGVEWSAGIQQMTIRQLFAFNPIQIDDIQFESPNGVLASPSAIAPSGTVATATPAFSWQAQPCATWYQLWVNDSTGNRIKRWYTSEQVNAASGTCQIAPGEVLAEGSGQWWVRGWSAERGNGPWSSGRSFTVFSILPAPILLDPSGTIATTTPTYTWEPVEGATWYQLWVNDSTGNRIKKWYTAEQVDAASGQCSITPSEGLSLGTGQWWVRAYDEQLGNGEWSAGRPFTIFIPLPAPQTISPTSAIPLTTPTYRWQPVAGATWYQLWVNDSTGNRIKQWFTAAQVNAASGECSITPSVQLTPGAATWWVRAWNTTQGNGSWSLGRSFFVAP